MIRDQRIMYNQTDIIVSPVISVKCVLLITDIVVLIHKVTMTIYTKAVCS